MILALGPRRSVVRTARACSSQAPGHIGRWALPRRSVERRSQREQHTRQAPRSPRTRIQALAGTLVLITVY